MRKGHILLVILSILTLSGLACLEVKEEKTDSTGNLNRTVFPTLPATVDDKTTPTPSPTIMAEVTPTQTPTVLPTPPVTETPSISEPTEPTPTRKKSRCETDMEVIQAAIDVYSSEYDQWPTINGQPGDVDWDKMIPDYMDEKPYDNDKCKWGVNSDPVGIACIGHYC